MRHGDSVTKQIIIIIIIIIIDALAIDLVNDLILYFQVIVGSNNWDNYTNCDEKHIINIFTHEKTVVIDAPIAIVRGQLNLSCMLISA